MYLVQGYIFVLFETSLLIMYVFGFVNSWSRLGGEVVQSSQLSYRCMSSYCGIGSEHVWWPESASSLFHLLTLPWKAVHRGTLLCKAGFYHGIALKSSSSKQKCNHSWQAPSETVFDSWGYCQWEMIYIYYLCICLDMWIYFVNVFVFYKGLVWPLENNKNQLQRNLLTNEWLTGSNMIDDYEQTISQACSGKLRTQRLMLRRADSSKHLIIWTIKCSP